MKNLDLESEQATAFEYVLGTLRGKDREAFKAKISRDPNVENEVYFWEERLMALGELPKAEPSIPNAPLAGTWEAIAESLTASESAARPTRNGIGVRIGAWIGTWIGARKGAWVWASAVAFCAIFIFSVVLQVRTAAPNTDYIAVLTNEKGEAQLTALTTGDNAVMWLQWEAAGIKAGTNAQLWAVSKRDGESRPLAVFDETAIQQIALSEANWRLVTDAAYLVLTEEEPGGSAIDEPSEIILAKGVCIRFEKDKHAG